MAASFLFFFFFLFSFLRSGNCHSWHLPLMQYLHQLPPIDPTAAANRHRGRSSSIYKHLERVVYYKKKKKKQQILAETW